MTSRRLGPVLRTVLLSLATLTAAPSATQAADPSSFALSGFATLGAVTTDRKDVWFTRYGVNFPGGGDPDISPDSLIGLQGSFRFAPSTDITVQVLGREDGEEDHGPHVSLAFLRHNLAPGLSVRAGRLRVPFFMLSDSLYVNFSNTWVRPPVEVYGLNPFNDLDGVDFIYHARIGDTDIEIHPYYGSSGIPFPEGKARLKETWGANFVVTHGDFSLHVGHGDGRFSLERTGASVSALAGALRGLGDARAADSLSGKKGETSFDSIGIQWDDGRWQVIGEYARRWTNRYVTTSHGWYVSVARRFGTMTPYLMIARQRLEKHIVDGEVPGTAPQPIADAVRNGLKAFRTSRNNAQRSVTLGARWDVTRYAALKVEAMHARPDNDSWGSYFPRGDAQPLDIAGRPTNTFSLSLDLTF